MGNIKSLIVLGFALTAMAAHADNFTFTFTGNQVSASGSLVGTDNMDGSFTITSGNLFVNSDTTGTASGMYNITTNGGSNYTWDNLLLFTSNPQVTTTGGILFSNGSQRVEIYALGSTAYLSAENSTGGQNSPIYNPGDAGQFVAVPEPASLAVLGLGAVGLIRRRKKA